MELENLKKLKRNEISDRDLVDSWLITFFNTTLSEVEKDYTKDESGKFSPEDTRNFYKKYSISQEQHDEWEKAVKKILRKKLRLSKKFFDRSWPLTYLNVAPSTK